RAFHDRPAVVGAGRAAQRGGRYVDFLARVLPDVADVEVAGQPVEAEAPRIAETDVPQLALLAGAGVRVAARARVPAPRADVDAEQGAEQIVLALAVPVGVVAAAAVAEADPQHAVRTERDQSAVVVVGGLVDREHDLVGRGDRDVVARRVHVIARDLRVTR